MGIVTSLLSYQFRLLKNCEVLTMGVSFQGRSHSTWR
jgi:hypothetical protein